MKRSLFITSPIIFIVSACLPLAAPTSAPLASPSLPPALTPVASPTSSPSFLTPAGAENPTEIDARQYIEYITETIGARGSGSTEETTTAQYIAGVLAGFGYSSEIQPFTDKGYIGDTETTIQSANVVALKPGLSSREIIVGAHYDSAEISLGADDNASGVGVLLAAAGWVADVDTPYTIVFIAFGAEEAGLLGSYAYMDSRSTAEIQNIVAMINLDALIAGDINYVYSDEQKSAVRDWALAWAQNHSYDLETIRNVDLTDEEGYHVSDYGAFKDAGIPFAYFEATNWNLGDQDGYTQVAASYGEAGVIFHTRFDNLDYIDKTFPGRVDQHLDLFTSLVYAILTQFQMP
jgi:hypothetical protein